ncbi:hypothetical protein KC340_g15986 [Hortaea werneckii]|nr:hypothetical protein KC342_g16217 [Hortaea werneckii]KAI7065436.1 hypothetical protein KC339_g15786 [Hortaea werneckii]KAI7207974.1 hypothetical protein KC365_g16294 [Hortaea werneckii]KAI7294925.1 hypothetical protein KC340_g15986 [Hortaea werneckii]KAI7373993.1 hypothetical protein KC328_g16278 [Hortaea werneckii]
MDANTPSVTSRRAYRRTDDFTIGTPKIKLVTEPLPPSLQATEVLVKVHAVALDYRDANITHGGNPWPVTPRGIICNDAAGEVIATGQQVKTLHIGGRVAPNTDTANLTGRESSRSWLAADEDGVLADYLVYDEKVLGRLPAHLSWVEASTVPCAGVTAWSALKGAETGQSVLIQGTGGVAMFALKLARAMGLRIILTSSSDKKLKQISEKFAKEGTSRIDLVNYSQNPDWHEEVLQHTDGEGVDIVLENGGPGTLLKSIKCTRRGGIVSQVGYLDRARFDDAPEVLPLLIDRRIVLRGINAGSKSDLDDLCRALKATRIRLDDIIDSVWSFDKADEALQYLWEGKQIGKLVIKI